MPADWLVRANPQSRRMPQLLQTCRLCAHMTGICYKFQLAERQQILRLMEMSEGDIEAVRITRRLFAAVTIHAPIAGTVTKRHASPGERVSAAAPIYSVGQLNPVWVNVQVPAARLSPVQEKRTG